MEHAPKPSSDILAALRTEARDLPDSGIIDVLNHGLGRDGLIPLWVGEGDLPTPAFICDSAVASLRAGETCYTHQRGIPTLRDALATYHSGLFGQAFAPDMFFVTIGGMQAIQTAVQCVAGKGDEVLVPTPAWPNFAAAIRGHGAIPVSVPMDFSDTGWRLDLDRFFDAVTPRTTALFVNSPANPTGWVMPQDEIHAVADFARKRGLWVIADEVYTRFHYPGGLAPSFWHAMELSERLLMVNTFSKNWAMTGWRVGWIAADPALGQVIENIIQYGTSGVPQFHQRACVTAIEDGERFLEDQFERARTGRKIVIDALRQSNRVRVAEPDGAFYAFFTVDGIEDTMQAALRLIDEAGVGVAPGATFGQGGEQFMRICFLRSADQLEEAMDRLTRWLAERA